MKKTFFIKFIIYSIYVFCFSALSLITRNILISQYNGYDLKLLSIEHINNYGAAFSLFNNHTFLLIIISIFILLFIFFYILKNIASFSLKDTFFTALLTSGILCNMVERITDGHVTDYIKLNFINFPIFNVSDIFICIGAFILICNILFSDEQ